MATEFFWTAPQNLEHAVTFTPWNTGLIVPSALSPTAYSYTVGASGLVDQPVVVASGMKGGFAGSVSDNFGGAWLVGYSGDVTYIAANGDSMAYGIPTAASGEVFVGAALCEGNPYFVTANGDLFTVASGVVTSVLPGFGERVSSLTATPSRLYAVLPQSGNLATYLLVNQVQGTIAKSLAPMDVPAFAVASNNAVAVGGYSNSTLPYPAVYFESSPFSTTATAAVDTPSNFVYLFSGTDPDWMLSSAVSGTGAPVSLAWASSGEQILVADDVNAKVEVINVVEGTLVPAQTLAISGVTALAVTSDGLTALAMRPAYNSVSILSNVANQWSVASTVSVSGAASALGLTNTEFVIGGSGALTWIESANNGWISAATVSGLAYTPNGLATDGNGTIFTTGTNAGIGYLSAVNQQQVLANATWTGSGNSVIYEQAQIAVADATNSLIRLSAYQSGNLVQQGTVAGPSGVKSLATTSLSLWACGTSGIWQLGFTGPFTIDRQPEGIFALYHNGAWVSGATGVYNQPTAAAWDVSGTVWAATQKDILNRFSMSAVAVSGISLAPYLSSNGVPIGISSMLWWQNGLFAVSSLNSALMEVSGSAAGGTPGVVPGVLLGVNFILGESFYQ